MKILFLHLSDIHIKSGQNINIEIIDSLIQSLNSLKKFDACAIIITGDIANSGIENEYKAARYLVGNLISKIKEKYKHITFVPLYIVPGNHDMNFQNIQRDRSDIAKLIKDKKIDENIGEELNKFKCFFDFAKAQSCFKNNYLVDVLYWNLNDYRIQINLVNSELFSTYRSMNNDNDKGIHYLPLNEVEKIRRNIDSNLVITLSHRSPEWFEWESGNKFKSLLQRDSDIIFIGHDHVNGIIPIDDAVISSAEGMDFANYKFSFSSVLLDTDLKKCSINIFEWNEQEGFFSILKNKDLYVKNNILYGIKPNYQYIKDLDQDENEMNIRRYFVFQGVEIIDEKNGKNLENITEWDKFLDVIRENKKIFIEGDDLSGKTTILKQVYIDFQKDKVPIYLDINGINLKHADIQKEMDRFIRHAFEEQYEKSIDYFRFQQLDNNKKIIIIDDYDKIKNNFSDKIMRYIEEKFACIIVSCRPTWTNIVEETKNKLSNENEQANRIKLKILPFYTKKRKDLIQKYYEVNKSDSQNIEKEVNKINLFIKNQLKIFGLNPSFITMYVNYCIRTTELTSTSNIFGKVYENNLVNAIRKSTTDDNLDEYSVMLEEIAYYIHFHEIDPISIIDITKIITDYNKDFALNIDVQNFIKVMQSAKILKGEDNYYRFYNNNLLAYFVAKSINARIQNGADIDDLSKITENICLNINGEVLLFLTYITDNYKILEFLKKTAKEHMDTWTEFNLDLNNIRFISTKKEELIIDLPSQKDREIAENEERKQEENVVKKSSNSVVKNLYEDDKEDKNTSQYKFDQALKYTELIAKALPSFNHRLKKEEKEIYADIIYRYPNKILYTYLHDIDEFFDYIIENIYTFLLMLNIHHITKDNIKEQLVKSAENNIFFILDYYTRLCANEKTINILGTFNSENTNHLLQKLLMYHHVEDFDNFSKIANKIYDNNAKNPLIKSMVKRIVHRHFLVNKDLVMVGDVAKIAHKYFKTTNKRDLLN